jgi:two-component system chemotaxis response regulator CheB
MVVDDSVVFRSQIKRCLDDVDGIQVLATASNGKLALSLLDVHPCDVVILDLEMPEMNGLEFLQELRTRGLPQRVIVFASPTKDGAGQALEAFRAGAVDFIAKPSAASSLEEALEGVKRELVPKVLQFARRHLGPANHRRPAGDVKPSAISPPPSARFVKVDMNTFRPRIIVVGSSTGGPTALEGLFAKLKGIVPRVPVVIAQHMPPNFTDLLARRFETLSGIPSAEGRNGEDLLPGRVYVAPGDFHLSIQRIGDKATLKTDQTAKRNSVRPAVDTLFESAAREFGPSVAAFVLTGMGEDGRTGTIAIKEAGGGVMIQNRESSVVWGMPGSVCSANAYDLMGDMDEISRIIKSMVS